MYYIIFIYLFYLFILLSIYFVKYLLIYSFIYVFTHMHECIDEWHGHLHDPTASKSSGNGHGTWWIQHSFGGYLRFDQLNHVAERTKILDMGFS